MKKIRNKSAKKGFTLVELIVVLVILAILAAMLIPALTGYIRRARQEKDYLFAATVLTAAQAAATYQYSLPTSQQNRTITQATSAGNGETVAKLVGGDASFTCSFSTTSDFGIKTGSVTIGDYKYSWTGTEWKAEEV